MQVTFTHSGSISEVNRHYIATTQLSPKCTFSVNQLLLPRELAAIIPDKDRYRILTTQVNDVGRFPQDISVKEHWFTRSADPQILPHKHQMEITIHRKDGDIILRTPRLPFHQRYSFFLIQNPNNLFSLPSKSHANQLPVHAKETIERAEAALRAARGGWTQFTGMMANFRDAERAELERLGGFYAHFASCQDAPKWGSRLSQQFSKMAASFLAL